MLDDKAQQEAKVSVEAKVEPKSSVISSPSSLSSKSQSIGSTKNKSSIENRPSAAAAAAAAAAATVAAAEESSEPSKLSPTKREANERLRSPDIKSTPPQPPLSLPVQSLEQEINDRKAEYQSTTTPTSTGANKSGKLSDALDKLVCKQKVKEQQQQQKQAQKAGKQSKRLSSHSFEENKSPIDMDIEPKESTERDEIIDIVKEQRGKYSSRNEVQIQSLTNDTASKLTDALNQSDQMIDDDSDHSRSNTNKYEQEQFVNNMPKPPTPKSSMIFSPPPTSLTIDKREASIFDFTDNFPIPLSFNADNLFKEDSAKETMDLVANLRQNIKKGGKGDDCSRTKPEQIETSPDSTTTIDTSVKTSAVDTKPSKSLDSKTKAVLPPPTLVIDLDQENSGDESKPPQEETPQTNVNTAKSGHKDQSNWMSNTLPMDKERGNLMNMMTTAPAPPMQLQTEVEQIASKMSNVIPTPADMLAENELNEAQNLNAFHMQPYACNAFNGNKEAFDRSIQIQVSYFQV